MVRNMVYKYLLYLIAPSIIVWYGYNLIYDRGFNQCEVMVDLQAKELLEAQIEDYELQVAKTNEVSKKLLDTQRKLQHVQSKNTLYASTISGTCDPKLRLLVTYASAGEEVPTDTSTPEAEARTSTEAKPITDVSENIAINYARHHNCVAQLNAILDLDE